MAISLQRSNSCGRLPETPLPGLQNVDTEGKVGDGMGQDALGDAAGLVEQQIEESACHDAGDEVVMFETEKDTGY